MGSRAELTVVAAPPRSAEYAAAEFFAGIGLVRLGLEAAGFTVGWSNDYDPKKHRMYVGQFGDGVGRHVFRLGDVGEITATDLPQGLALAWASFPCTDLSLAGDRGGLDGGESKTFWEFTRILHGLGAARPAVVALENVPGLATSNGGADLIAAVRELNALGYSVDVLQLDALRFVPQSRERLFLVGALNPPVSAGFPALADELRPPSLRVVYENQSLMTHRAPLPPPPSLRRSGLAALIERMPDHDGRWWDRSRVDAFLAGLSPLQGRRLAGLQDSKATTYRTAYRRTRNRVAMWEIRSDDISGCLRTARGGSSKQAVVAAGRGKVKVRWMTPREYARLMGADEYNLAGLRANEAYFGFGDAVCVPVVSWLAEHYLLPLVRGELQPTAAMAASAAR